MFVLIIDEAEPTFGISFSVSPGPSFPCGLGGRPLVEPLREEESITPGRGAEVGVPSEASGDWDSEC